MSTIVPFSRDNTKLIDTRSPNWIPVGSEIVLFSGICACGCVLKKIINRAIIAIAPNAYHRLWAFFILLLGVRLLPPRFQLSLEF